MQLVFGSDNALTGGSLLLSVYLYEQHIERSTQVVGGGVQHLRPSYWSQLE
ncbi:hypothetical protein [Pseudoruminococcus massiliensis]|uniref:hypothetical protein n=1 Tax=Pseudoruminococcus massiliensis TaxID=2086583 RepID=UPI0020692D29|nr:MAG TPA: hypothetical protein [Caudoviricetes sp.]